MPRGRVSPLAEDKLAYLRGCLAEYEQLQAAKQLHSFWPKTIREWFRRWPVEPGLGLPLLDTGGVLIEDSGVPKEHQRVVGEAQEAEKAVRLNGVIRRE